ncbi:hypothetical protein J7U46_08805 [Pelomonas sp. V22]|uniref:hypothetical protein n=1 Tax=Pelomonas sp. V22 TaxID=2822139 RepID=UPI0024A8DA73|nr:hypothetical protein [Pelomonas sp. V22]MDI4633143.1 hypothetical protein [Pelomonas sp. V22]
MSRNATPLLAAPAFPDLDGGAEAFMVQTCLAHPVPGEPSAPEEERSICVAVLITPDEHARRSLRTEAARYVGGRTQVASLCGADWGRKLLMLLHEAESAFIDVVVGIPSTCSGAQSEVMATLQQLRGFGHHQVCTVFVVSTDPAHWRGTGECVVMPHDGDAIAGAIALHAGLAQLSAPQMIECVTTEDVDTVFRSGERLASMYLTDALGLPHAVEVLECSLNGKTNRRVAALFFDDLSLRGYSAAARTLRAAGFSEPVVVAPHGLTVAPILSPSPRCVLVVGGGDDSPTSNERGERV